METVAKVVAAASNRRFANRAARLHNLSAVSYIGMGAYRGRSSSGNPFFDISSFLASTSRNSSSVMLLNTRPIADMRCLNHPSVFWSACGRFITFAISSNTLSWCSIQTMSVRFTSNLAFVGEVFNRQLLRIHASTL